MKTETYFAYSPPSPTYEWGRCIHLFLITNGQGTPNRGGFNACYTAL